MNAKSSLALISIFSNTFLVIKKLAAGKISVSVCIISEAIHSSMDQIALEADALHLKTDVYASLGVTTGPGPFMITKIYWLDVNYHDLRTRA